MTDDSVRGRFIWHELRTPNPAGARDFYSAALGWSAEAAEPDSSDSTFLASTGPLGGCSSQSPTAAPRWIPFVTVPNADDSLSEAVGLGASVVIEPTALESGGRYAVLTDPQGAAIGVYSADDVGADRDPRPGEFSWHELATIDPRAALDFYSLLFGWELIREHDMGPMGIYRIFGYDGKQLGGIFDKESAGMSGDPAWLSYVRVTDLSGTIEKVKAARGSVLTGPMEVPGGDWVAQLLDPHGAPFALHAVAADAKGEAEQAARATEEHAKTEPANEEGAKPEASAALSSASEGANVATAKAAGGEKKRRTRLNARTADAAITDIWSATAADAEDAVTTKASTKKATSKQVATKQAAKEKASTAKAAKSKATKKKASSAKKAGAKTAKKKAGATKKAAGRTAAKKAAKKSAKKKAAQKKAAETTSKKAAKTTKKTKKTTTKSKTKSKTAKKAATKKAAAKKTGEKTPVARKSGKKAGQNAGKTAGAGSRKKSGKTAGTGSRKKSGTPAGKSGKTAGSSARKKSGKASGRSAGSNATGKKKPGKKSRKKSGRR